MASRTVRPVQKTRATLTVPGDKSISHRAAIVGAIAEGVTTVEGFLTSEDCLNTLRAVQAMGVRVERDGEKVAIHGVGLNGLREPATVVDVGNSGTGIRLLAGLAAGQPFRTVLTGDASIRLRPMGRIVEPLTRMGARIRGEANNTLAPLEIHGGDLRGIRHESSVASAQVKSAILLAGLYANSPTTVCEPTLSRDYTERMLTAFGANVRRDGTTVTVLPRPTLTAQALAVPGDISSAAFFVVAGLLIPDAEVVVTGVGLNPTRTGLLTALSAMGAGIAVENERMIGAEPVGDIRVWSSSLRGGEFGGELIVQMIDEIPILALAATQARGETVVRDAAELRVKESDRIATVVDAFRRLGVEVEPLPDGFRIVGPQRITGGDCSSHGDHRIAMTAAIAGLIASESVTVHDIECIDTSFPTFWKALGSL
jgi:3-phosphoshikimate 1-carboxyvinyltransferase